MDRYQNLFEFGDTLVDGVCRAKFLQFVAQMLRTARSDIISRARRQSRRRSLPSAALRKIHIFFDEGSAHPEKYRTGNIGRPLENRVLKVMEKCSCVPALKLHRCYPHSFAFYLGNPFPRLKLGRLPPLLAKRACLI